jgi:tetratricopeptide (TPR) repeat protein
LKDGSLQSGNLVKEDAEQFILLTKEGRQEIPKSNIMFVNGKTLAQWNARPDKTYSTEILPSELPDRAFINNKAELPPPVIQPPVKLPPVQKSVLPPPSTEAAKPAAAQAVEPPEPMDMPEEPAEVKAAPAPVVKKEPAPVEKPKVVEAAPVKTVIPVATTPRRVKKVKPLVTEDVKSVAPPVEPVAVKPAPVVRVGKFDREGYAINHYNLAQLYLSQGERGRAAQELHMSYTLNKWDEKTALALGTFYKEEGIYPRARRYFEVPALRKRPEVQKMVHEMDLADQRAQRRPWIFGGSLAGGIVLAFAGVAMLRRFARKPAAPPLIVTSENIDEIADRFEEVEPLPTIAPAAEKPVFNPRPLSESAFAKPKPIELPKPVMPELKPFEPKAPEPVVPEPVVPPPMAPEPAMAKDTKPQSPFDDVFKVTDPPVVQPAMSMPAPEPIRIEPVKIEPAKPYERILETERVVSEALKKGNQLAAEGNVELARREYRTAAALNTSNVDAQLGLAYLCFLQEQWELSMQHYLNALQINPRSADAHYGLGRVLSELGRVNDAIPELRKALELDPTLFDAQETLTSLGQLA